MTSTATETGPLLLPIKDAAPLLGLSEWQVRGLGEDGKLPVEKIRGRWYIPAKAVHEYVAKIGGKA